MQENKHLEQGMKEILQAIKDMQQDAGVKGGETALMIPSLERLVNVSPFLRCVYFIQVNLFAFVKAILCWIVFCIV